MGIWEYSIWDDIGVHDTAIPTVLAGRGFPKLGILFGGSLSYGLEFWGLDWGPLSWETTIKETVNFG